MSSVKTITIDGTQYDIKDEVARTDLENKADKATTMAGYGITDGVTMDTAKDATYSKESVTAYVIYLKDLPLYIKPEDITAYNKGEKVVAYYSTTFTDKESYGGVTIDMCGKATPVGTEELTIAEAIALNANKIGSETLQTSATTCNAAINELKATTDKVGTSTLKTTAQTCTDAINELKNTFGDQVTYSYDSTTKVLNITTK